MDPDVSKFAQFLLVVFTFGGIGIGFLAALRFVFARKPKQPAVTSGVDDARFARLEQAVDAIALEVERIAEGQRFTTKLLADRAAERLPAESERD